MKKIITVLLFTICLFAQEKNKSKNLKENLIDSQENKIDDKKYFEEGDEYAPKQSEPKSKEWYVAVQGHKGNSATGLEKGDTNGFKVVAEYRMNPFFGIGFGFSNTSLNLVSTENPVGRGIAFIFLNSTPTPPRGQIATPENTAADAEMRRNLALFALLPVNYDFKYRALNFDLNYHFLGDKFFDPFIGVGVMLGKCHSVDACSLYGAEIKAGVQLNFETPFILIQYQDQSIRMKNSSLDSTLVHNQIISIGAGNRF